MKKLVFALATLAIASAFAAEGETTETTNQSSAKVDDLKQADQKVKDNDDEITNPRLRATLGSKSKWSFRSSLNYSGGPAVKPFGAVRPNIINPNAQLGSVSSIDGQVGLNYRATKTSSINAGVTVNFINPLGGSVTETRINDPRPGRGASELDRYQVRSPYIGYNLGYKVAGVQMATELSYSHATDNDSRGLGTFGSSSLSQTIILNPGDSKFSGGLYLSGSAGFFDRAKASNYQNQGRTEYFIGATPFAEYQFNDKFGLRTVFNWANFVKLDTTSQFVHLAKQQSAGLAISFSRDLYIYPNFQFIPDDIRIDRSNVGVSTIINL